MEELSVGIKGTSSMTVEEPYTAKSMKSGTLDVLATPAVVSLAEACAWVSIQPYLSNGQSTVGTAIQIEHKAPTPLGMEIFCQTELIQINGRKLTFSFKVSDPSGEVASGIHDRFIIDTEKFIQKANQKKEMLDIKNTIQ